MRAAQMLVAMTNISDALELLTAQHDEIDDLLATIQQTADAGAFDLLADKLVAHITLEHELFYPVISATIARDVMDELLDEHLAMKRVLGEMLWLGVDDPAFPTKLADLQILFLGHCTWQEQEMFQTIAESMSVEWLAELGSRLQEFDTAFPLAIAA